MNYFKAAHVAGIFALTTLATSLARAEDYGWYVGGNLGQTRATIDDPRIDANLRAKGFTFDSIADDKRSFGGKVFGGYQFNNYLAVEGGYFNLGKFGYTATTVPAGTLRGDTKIQGVNLDLVGRLPVTDAFSVFGRAGLNYASVRDRFSGTGAVVVQDPSPSKREANLKVGLGMEYALNKALSVRGEVERYRINDAVGNHGDVDMVSVGLVYRFGGAPESVAYRAPAPAPVYVAAAEPPPAPAVTSPPVVMAEKPVPRKVSFSADSLFDFDKSTIKPEGKRALDKFAADLKGSTFTVVEVTGHADRIGSHAHNQRLSESRASAVKSYLVDTAAIPVALVSAKGVDGTDPVTKPGDCVGRKPTPKLIACLQPDRRVDVEVSGTR
jgi:OOP family OmpA-OmpF porin